MAELKPVVFFDRDGTLNEEIGYIREIEHLNLIPGAAKAVSRLNKLNVACILTSNQSGAARGYYSLDHIEGLNARLQKLLKEKDAYLDAVYYCPHLPNGTIESLSISCDCRKPAPGLVEQAFANGNGLDRSRCYIVGDKDADVGLAKNAGIKGILVRTGYGRETEANLKKLELVPDFVADDIQEAVDWIINDLGL